MSLYKRGQKWATALLLSGLSLTSFARLALADDPHPPPVIDHLELTADDHVQIWFRLGGTTPTSGWKLTFQVLTPAGVMLDSSDLGIRDHGFTRTLQSVEVGPLSKFGRGSSKQAQYCFSLKMYVGDANADPSNVQCIGAEPPPPPSAPLDLWVSKIEVTQGQGVMGCLPGKSNIVVASISDAGDIPVNATIPVQLKVDGAPVMSRTMGGIEKQQTRELAFEGVDIPAGGHVLTATVDPAGQFAEAREGNNATSLNVMCSAPKPDLEVTQVSLVGTSVTDGQPAVFLVVMINNGAPVKDTAQILIGFMGPLEPVLMMDEQDGFTCEQVDLGFTCTGSLGGQDDPQHAASFIVHARGNGTGKAAIYGSANHDRSLDEVTVDNNLKLVDITVQ